MNQYETVFILTPVLSDEQTKETVAKFKKVLTDKGAEIVNEEAWGLKKMAYAIQKKSTGFYCLMEFKAEPEVIKVWRLPSVVTRRLSVSRQLSLTSMPLSMLRSVVTNLLKKRRLKLWHKTLKSAI